MPDRDELDELWCGQTIGPPRKGEDMLAIAIKKANQFDRTIKVRNWTECGASVAVAVLFGFLAWHAPNLLTRAGSLAVAASGLWIVFVMLRYGREAAAPGPDQSLAGFQQALLRKYDHQVRLLKNVKYWYLLPLYVGLLLRIAGEMQASAGGRLGIWPELAAVILCTAVFAAIWWLNEGYAVARLRRLQAELREQMNPAEGESR